MSENSQLPMLVWQVTEAAPMGEWVDARTLPAGEGIDEGPHEAGAWTESSFDLLLGVEVGEPDTVPGDLFGELFLPRVSRG